MPAWEGCCSGRGLAPPGFRPSTAAWQLLGSRLQGVPLHLLDACGGAVLGGGLLLALLLGCAGPGCTSHVQLLRRRWPFPGAVCGKDERSRRRALEPLVDALTERGFGCTVHPEPRAECRRRSSTSSSTNGWHAALANTLYVTGTGCWVHEDFDEVLDALPTVHGAVPLDVVACNAVLDRYPPRDDYTPRDDYPPRGGYLARRQARFRLLDRYVWLTQARGPAACRAAQLLAQYAHGICIHAISDHGVMRYMDAHGELRDAHEWRYWLVQLDPQGSEDCYSPTFHTLERVAAPALRRGLQLCSEYVDLFVSAWNRFTAWRAAAGAGASHVMLTLDRATSTLSACEQGGRCRVKTYPLLFAQLPRAHYYVMDAADGATHETFNLLSEQALADMACNYVIVVREDCDAQRHRGLRFAVVHGDWERRAARCSGEYMMLCIFGRDALFRQELHDALVARSSTWLYLLLPNALASNLQCHPVYHLIPVLGQPLTDDPAERARFMRRVCLGRAAP